MRWKLSRTVLRGGTGGNTSPLLDASEGGKKRARNFTLPDRPVFGFAGLWDVWEDGGKKVVSCCVVTTAPNELVRPVHDRMPVIRRRPVMGGIFHPGRSDLLGRAVEVSSPVPCSDPVSETLPGTEGG